MKDAVYETTFSIRRLWIILSVGMVVMFGLLLLLGREIYRQAPPIPEAVQTEDGTTLFGKQDILLGQNVWQSIGGDAARLHLGPRQLSCSRLVGGLAPPRGTRTS